MGDKKVVNWKLIDKLIETFKLALKDSIGETQKGAKHGSNGAIVQRTKFHQKSIDREPGASEGVWAVGEEVLIKPLTGGNTRTGARDL